MGSHIVMAASLPEPGQTRSLAPNAEKWRKEYADWVSTVEDQFVKKEGKRLAELVHDEQFVKAKGIVELLGIDKPKYVAILRNDTSLPITVDHQFRSYSVSLGQSTGNISCYTSNPTVEPGIFLIIGLLS